MIQSCDYCCKSFNTKELVPMYEKNKPHVNLICVRCLPEVKDNIRSLPWRHLYTFGEKGTYKKERE